MTIFQEPAFPALFRVDEKGLRQFDRDMVTVLVDAFDNLKAILEMGINEDNLDKVFVTFTSNGSSDTEDSVAHTLGKVPQGFRVVNKDKAADVYDSGTAWTKTNIFLKTNVATAILKLEVF